MGKIHWRRGISIWRYQRTEWITHMNVEITENYNTSITGVNVMELRTSVCWRQSSMSFAFLHVMWPEALTTLTEDKLSKQTCRANSLGKQTVFPSKAKGAFPLLGRHSLPLGRGQTCLVSVMKRHLIESHFRNCNLSNQCKQMLSLWLLLLLLVIKSFVSAPETPPPHSIFC